MNAQKLIQAYKDEKEPKTKDRILLAKLVYVDKQVPAHAAKILGHPRSWAYKWLPIFKKHGIEGMSDAERSGRPPKVPKKKMEAIKKKIEKNPAGWTGKEVMDLIYRESGVKYHEMHVYRLLREWGYTPKVPRKKFVNAASPQERQDFKKKPKRR